MKLLCISLGCDKNLVDAERMLGSLSQDGYTFTDDEQEADVILVNTCCFINDAKEESQHYLRDGRVQKERNLQGALSQRLYGTALQGRDPAGGAGGGRYSRYDQL